MADHLALAADIGLFGAEKAVGVDLHFQAAVAEDAFGHHCDHVHPARLGRHDEGCRLVVRVGGGRTDTGDENLVTQQKVTIPTGLWHRACRIAVSGGARRKGHQQGFLRAYGAAQQNHRVDPYQGAGLVGIAVAGAAAAFGNLTQYGTGIAGDLGRGGALCCPDWRRSVHPRKPVCLCMLGHLDCLVLPAPGLFRP